MKNLFTQIGRIQALFVCVMLVTIPLGTANASEIFHIEAKSAKTLKIGVIDLISHIEVAALVNRIYLKEAKKRGWDLQVFDLKGNPQEAATILDNMMVAKFDGVIVNWTETKYFALQLEKAYKKGIPIFGNHCGKPKDGLTADFSASLFAQGSTIANVLVNQMDPNDHAIILNVAGSAACNPRMAAAKEVFEYSKIKVSQEFPWTGGSDPEQFAYDMTSNALLADSEKQIKGIFTCWEGLGRAAARAAMERGRKDVKVVTVDDSPQTYATLRDIPNLFATVGLLGKMPTIVERMFVEFEKIFAGKAFKVQQILFPSYIVTQDDLPPKGYFFRESGVYKGQADFEDK